MPPAHPMPPEHLLQALLQATNQARSRHQQCDQIAHPAVSPLVLNIRLIAAAQLHAEDMARRDFFSHTGSDQSDVVARVVRQQYNYQMVGENIAAGPMEVATVVQGWLNSPGHCQNLMHPLFREVGFGFAHKPGTQFGTYWVQVLGVQMPRQG